MEVLVGVHLLADGLVADVPTAHKLDLLLDRLLSVTGLTPLPRIPRVIDVRAPHWQAFQVIAESHIAVSGHNQEAHVDVFSCHPFSADATMLAIQDGLGGRWRTPMIIDRSQIDA